TTPLPTARTSPANSSPAGTPAPGAHPAETAATSTQSARCVAQRPDQRTIQRRRPGHPPTMTSASALLLHPESTQHAPNVVATHRQQVKATRNYGARQSQTVSGTFTSRLARTLAHAMIHYKASRTRAAGPLEILMPMG